MLSICLIPEECVKYFYKAWHTCQADTLFSHMKLKTCLIYVKYLHSFYYIHFFLAESVTIIVSYFRMTFHIPFEHHTKRSNVAFNTYNEEQYVRKVTND